MTLRVLIPTLLLLVPIAEGQLLTGARVDRPLTVGEVHHWEVDAAAGDFVQVVAVQRGVDVVATVLDPAGQAVGTFDTPNGDLEQEIRFIAGPPGRYRVEIRAAMPEAEPGRYSIRLAARRPATATDRRVAAAISAQVDANRLRMSPDARRASLERYRDAMALWREAGERAGEANALRAMGFAYIRLKEDDEAYKVFSQTRGLWRELGDVRAEAFALLVLGTIHTRREEPLDTRAKALEALPLFRRAGDRWQEAFTLGEIGDTYARMKNRAQADRWFDRALAVARKTRKPSLQAAILGNRARACEVLGDTAGALDAYTRSADLWDAARMPKHAAEARAQIAKLQTPRFNTVPH
ncbi:MAG TPA: tetratricopeptide repeat protein [Gemmatimonadaceae bacterium]|nr:tetratricopeptide repeat protein [Gemmatimonadaceae bacterium]